jgi:hypothetical protein
MDLERRGLDPNVSCVAAAEAALLHLALRLPCAVRCCCLPVLCPRTVGVQRTLSPGWSGQCSEHVHVEAPCGAVLCCAVLCCAMPAGSCS